MPAIIVPKRMWLIMCPLLAALIYITLFMPVGMKKSVSGYPVSCKLDLSSRDQMFFPTMRLVSVCPSENCSSDYLKHSMSWDARLIPPIRHILWKSELISHYFLEQLRSWVRIHPDWTFVLWRNADLEPLVATHFPGLLAKFNSLPDQIQKVDMIRYIILFKYGGTYADLDYTLVRSLDHFRRFPSVITREPEAHSLHIYGLKWPTKLLYSPAFMMSAPGHIFHHFAMQQLESRWTIKGNALSFAGPFGLTEILDRYERLFPIVNSIMEMIIVPPSYSFYPYPGNRLNNTKSLYYHGRIKLLKKICDSQGLTGNRTTLSLLEQYCSSDLNNMDLITDKSQPVYAIHDMQKTVASYEAGITDKVYSDGLINVTQAIDGVKFGTDFMRSP